MQSVSYSKFNKRSCMAVIGKKGRNALAHTIEKIFPKLELAVIRMYFDILINVFLPSKIPSSSTFKSLSNKTTSAASFAVSGSIPKFV